MVYTITIFPEFKGISKVEAVRKKYDPGFHFLKPHITLVYNFRKKPSVDIIEPVIKRFSSFKVKLNKIRASTKHNLIFLDVTFGKDKIFELKKTLYKDLDLSWSGNFLYKPHITIANLESKKEQKRVVLGLKKGFFDFSCVINSIWLLEIADNHQKIKSKRQFNLA